MDRQAPEEGLMAGQHSWGGTSLASEVVAEQASPMITPPACLRGGSGMHIGAGMSRSGAEPSPGIGSSLPVCSLAHYFVLFGIDRNRELEPDERVGKAGPQWHKGPLIPAGQAEGLHMCMDPCTGLLVMLIKWGE